MSFDTLCTRVTGNATARDPFTGNHPNLPSYLFIGHLCSHPAAPEAIVVIPLKKYLFDDRYCKLNPPPHFRESTTQFQVFFRSAFKILNDRKTIIKALVEEGILSKDAIEAFADDVPPRVPKPVRDDSMDASEVRDRQYYIHGTPGGPYLAPPGTYNSQLEQHQILYNELMRRQWRNQ